MIKINMLQPINPSSEYKFEHNDTTISPVVLNNLLGQIQSELDDLCNEVIANGNFIGRSENMQILCPGEPERPHLKSKTRSGKYSLGPKLYRGGSADKGYKNLDGLRRRYEQLFKVAKENFRKCSPDFPKIDIYIQLNFFKATVTKEMDALYPDES
jgi:hypothetical protein